MTLLIVLLAVGQPGAADPTALKARALEMRDAGQLDSAIVLYDRVLAADPADDEARLGKALALSWQGSQDEAFAVYDEVGPGSASYFEAVKGKGRVSGWAGRYREALEWLARAESLVPGDREVLVRRAQVLGWSGDHAAATALYRELVELEPGNADYLFGLGQNLEWSGRPMAARRWYGRALELAPGRDEISEASRRVAGAAAPRARIEYADARDDDGEVRGSYREYRFGYEQRLSDRLVPSVSAAWSSNRRSSLGNEYLLVRVGLSYRPFDWLGFNVHYRGDALEFAFKSAALAWEIGRSWLTWSGEAGRILFEPTLDFGAFSAATALTLRPLAGLRLDARAARLKVIDDGNEKTALSAGAAFDILSRPRVALGYTFSFDDFRDDSPRYYSPQGLVTNTIGASYRQRWSRTGLSAEAAGGPNGVREWVARASLSFDQQFPAGITFFTGLNYEQTTGRGRYAYFGLRAGVSRVF